MQPLKITIKGNFWDVQIYMGKLYLWNMNGSVVTLNWNKLVNSIRLYNGRAMDELALKCAFLDGSYLYSPALEDFFRDKDINELISKKIMSIPEDTFEISTDSWSRFVDGEQDNPFKELPTDTVIYNKKIFGITDYGLWSSGIAKRTTKPISSRATKLWDCPVLSMKASGYNQLSLSAGSEGLFEYNINDNTNYKDTKKVKWGVHQLTAKHSLFADYSGLSIYNSSNVAEGFLALFQWNKKDLFQDGQTPMREFSGIVSSNKIFKNSTSRELSWGSGDKIYKVVDGGVMVARFNNYATDEKYFSNIKKINLQDWKGEVVSGGVAYFGVIIECENALIVARSDGEFTTIEGPVTRWRVYPRSLNYENQLHVVLDDRVEIYSFNHDYFLDQSDKDLGVSYVFKRRRR